MIDEEKLLDQYRDDFLSKTGKKIDIKVFDKWESFCRLENPPSAEELFEMVLEAGGWEKGFVKLKSQRLSVVFPRKVVSFILHANDVPLKHIARLVGKDHTTIIHYLKTFEYELGYEGYYRAFLKQIIDYIS
jgi:chromosomal replication initiation ATPase DnaA